MAKLTHEDHHILYAALCAQIQMEWDMWECLTEDQLERAEELHMDFEQEVEDDEADLETIVHHAALTACVHQDDYAWEGLNDESLDAAEDIITAYAFRMEDGEDDEYEETSSEYESYTEDDDDEDEDEDEW